MKIIIEKVENGAVCIPPFSGEFEGNLAINLSMLMARTDDKEIIDAAYVASIDMACQWQAAHGYEPDPEAVRFEVVGNKNVLYHSRSGTKYLLKNGHLCARAWAVEEAGPHSVLEATVQETVEIPDGMTVGEYLASII